MTCVATVDLPQPPLWLPMTTTCGPKAPVLPPCCAMTRTPLGTSVRLPTLASLCGTLCASVRSKGTLATLQAPVRFWFRRSDEDLAQTDRNVRTTALERWHSQTSDRTTELCRKIVLNYQSGSKF